jgi:hypothetical protein
MLDEEFHDGMENNEHVHCHDSASINLTVSVVLCVKDI